MLSVVAFGLAWTILSGDLAFPLQDTGPPVSSPTAAASKQNMVPPQSSSGHHIKSNSDPAEITVRSVYLEGGSELPDAQALVTKGLRAHTYFLVEVSEFVRQLFSDDGYLHVEVSDPITAPIDSRTVDVTLRIKAGPQYRLNEIQISGAKAIAVTELRGLFPLQGGDIYNRGKIRKAFEAMRRRYETKGYINFVPIPDEEFDETGRTILLKVKIQEGKAFRFGPLKLSGVEAAPGVGHKILADWKPYLGQGFNIELVEQFIEEHFRLPRAKVAEFYWRHVRLELNEREGIAAILLLLPNHDPE
ncbi:MAG: hypothetical protein LAO21_08525 [Acidobacteriia bacterium]|nr:hypothetical protein [Terriglobia bacterium]